MNIKSIILVILTIICWACLVISLATPWYYVKSGSGDTYSINYYKYNSLSYKQYVNGDKVASGTYTLTSGDKSAAKSSVQTFEASLAFTVLAFVVITIFAFLAVLQLVGMLSKLGPIGGIAKFIPIVSLVFCLLAMFIFCGIANAKHRDCERNNGGDSTVCDASIYKKVVGSENGVKWGGSVAFAFIIIASGINLAIVVFNFISGVFNGEGETPSSA